MQGQSGLAARTMPGTDSAGLRSASAIRSTIGGNCARVFIDRPPLNILDLETIRRLREALEDVLANRAVLLVELHGTDNAFCAGVEIRDHFPERAPAMLREFHALIRSVLYARVPIIAVVRAHCLGGGMELALASDFVIAAENASFGQPEIQVGCFAPVASVLLPRLVPEKKALELLLTGDRISGSAAERLGLINRVAPPSSLDSELERFRMKLLAQSAAVLPLARKAARLDSRSSFESALRESERIYLDELLKTEDAVEGLNAFLEKRQPEWRNS